MLTLYGIHRTHDLGLSTSYWHDSVQEDREGSVGNRERCGSWGPALKVLVITQRYREKNHNSNM